VFDRGWRFGQHPGRLLVFALGAHESLPPIAPRGVPIKALDDANLAVDDQKANAGLAVYNRTCIICHGAGVIANGPTAPDLRASAKALDFNTFHSIVKGSLAPLGMPAFNDFTEEEIGAVFMYVRQQARAANKGP
jgi:quinohemoprotein ethanol dehydrogenase